MTRKVSLDCTSAQFHSLHLVVANARKGSKVIKVDKLALETLLRDHGRLCKVALAEGLVEGEL